MTSLFSLRTLSGLVLFWSGLIWGQLTQVIVHYEAGAGNFLAIRGSGFPLNWEQGQSCLLQSPATWVWTSTKLDRSIEFKILWNDQVWSMGGNYKLTPGRICEIYPFFGKNRGTIVYISKFWSSELKNTRTLRIYLPPSYFENKQKYYPVLYVQDGQNLFDPETSAFGVEWELDETLDRLILAGRIDEIVVVGIDNRGSERLFEYTTVSLDFPGTGGAEQYGDFLRERLRPYIQERYRVLTTPVNTGIMGSSLGGLVSFQLAWTEPSIFGKIAALSGSFWWNKEEWVSRVQTMGKTKKELQIYLDSGTIEDGLEETQRLAENLQTQGYDLMFYRDEGGRHQESFWAKRVEWPLTFLFPFQSTNYSAPAILKKGSGNE